MKKRLLASFLTAIIAITSVHMEAFALADTYNANNYIVDKVEQYGGSHVVITNTSKTMNQATGILPSVVGSQDIPALMNVDGEIVEAGEDVYGYDSLGQQLIDPAMVLPKLGEDISSDSSVQPYGLMQSVSTTSYKVGDTKTMYLMNQYDYGTYATECICVAIGEHCTVWIPVDDPYFVACGASFSVNTSEIPVSLENETTVSGNEAVPVMNESTISGNEIYVDDGVVEESKMESVSQNAIVTEENTDLEETIEPEEGVETEESGDVPEVLLNAAIVSSENAMVKAMQIVADEFDAKYSDMTNMFGDTVAADASGRGDADGKTAIICYDIFGDFEYGFDSYVAGYFWGADLKGYDNSTGNAMDCIHIDSYQGMGRADDYSINTEYIDNCYSTLVHEYQHMIHYAHLESKGLWANYTPTYINETFSAAAEYLMYGRNYSRTSYYNYYSSFTNGLSLTQWDTNDDVLMNYSVAYLFSQYIRAQYKGVVDDTGKTIYKDAMKELSNGKDLLDIIAAKIGTTSEDIWLNFRAALELKNETGPYGFGGDTEFTQFVKPKIYSGSTSSITLAPGGSIVIPIDEPYTPPTNAGSSLKYLGIDLEQTEEDIFISFVGEEPGIIDSFAGTLELKTNVSPYYLSQDVTYSIVEGEEYATVEDNILTAKEDGIVTVRATWNEKSEVYKDYIVTITGQHLCPISVSENSTGNTLEFQSFADAVKNLDFVASKKNGTYIFTFGTDSELSADVTLPDYVTEAVFKTTEYASATGKESVPADGLPLLVELDFAGKNLTSSGKVTIEEGLILTNSVEEKTSTLKMTKSNASGWNTMASLQLVASKEQKFANLRGEVVSEQDRAAIVKNVNIDAGSTAIELEREPGNTIPYTIDSDIKAQLLRVVESTEDSQGTWAVDGKLSLGILDMQESGSVVLSVSELSVSTGLKVGGTDTLYIDNASSVKDIQLLEDASFVTDKIIQVSGGKAYLAADSTWVINQSATIYNPVLSTEGGEEKSAYIYTTADASINLEGTLTRTSENVKLAFGKLSSAVDDVKDIALQDYSGQTKVFSTTNTKFPIDLIGTKQASEDSTSKYNVIYQTGNDVYIGANGIVVKSVGVSGEEVLESFAKWSDVATYLDTLANTPMEYVVEFSESLDMNEALTLPKKVTGITFRGAISSYERITLSYTGDIRLNSDTTFENIDLVAKKYNSSTKEYDVYESAVTLNGKCFTLKDASASFASVTGNNASRLVLENATVDVTKAVSSLGYLDMLGTAEIMEDGTANVDTVLTADNVTVTDTLTMQSAKIDCVNKIALKNVVSNDSYNILSYGGNTSKDNLTISGSITASRDAGMADQTVTINDGEQNITKLASARKNAIRLQVKSMEAAGYNNAALLCNAEKAGAGWFVVGSKWITADEIVSREITHATYKNEKAIYCGERQEYVKLFSSNSKDGVYAYESSFVTLQDALSEIDRLAMNTMYYRIEFLSAEENVVTFNSKVPTFPSKTAGITIAADKKLDSPYVYFKGNLSLKCDTAFEDIIFVPQTKSTVSLGNFTLELERCCVDTGRAGVGFTGISGSGVNGTSALVLNDTELSVAGSVNNIGTVVFTGEQVNTYALERTISAYPTLAADGSVNIGNVELEKDGYLTGLSTITRKDGKVTKIAPQIIINKEIYSTNSNVLYLDLQEKISNQIVGLNFDTNEMADIRKNGISLAKALYVTYPNIKAAQRNEDSNLVKAGSHLTYYEDGFGVVLSYKDTNLQTIVEIPCRTFADAVTEIKNQKSKRDYTITLYEGITEFSGVDGSAGIIPQALTMPNKSYVDTLTIQADEDAQDRSAIQLGFLNNITLTSNIVLKNVNFVQMIKNGTVYQSADFAKDDYPAALTFNTAGYHIDIEGENTFNTPIILNGGNKSILTFDTEGTITTFTNDYSADSTLVTTNVIYGMLSGFDTVTVNDCNLYLYDYKTSRTATSYTESKNKITTVNVFGTSTDNEGVEEFSGNIVVNSNSKKAEFTATNYNSEDGSLLVDGKVNLKNVSMEGDAVATIHADTSFDITGTLITRSDRTLLETRLKGAGKEPYLNVSGTVIRVGDTAPITVGVYPEIAAVNPKTPVNFKSDTVNSKQLLVVKNAQARDFMPAGENYAGGEYDVDYVPTGYMMLKTGDKIYVYNGSQVVLAVYKGDYRNPQMSELLGYYPTFAAATTDVNAIKDKTQKYTYVLTKQAGTIKAPTAVTLPSQAKSVTVTRLENNDESETIYLSGNITLQTATIFENIELAPVSKEAGTAFSISASGYDLALENVSVSDESDKMALKDISGNGKQTIVFDSPKLVMNGGISNALRVEATEDITIKGNVKTTTLALANNESGEEVICSINGTITMDYLENQDDVDSAKNTLEFSRNSSNVTNLAINKDIVNDGDIVLLRQDENKKITAVYKKNRKAELPNSAKAFVLPKTSTDSFALEAQCAEASGQTINFTENNAGYTVVKADKGVYIADGSLKDDIVSLKSKADKEDEAWKKQTNCLDYSQAINEINTLASADSAYGICFMANGTEAAGSNEIDTNVKDANRYGAFPLPKTNTYSQVMVVGVENGTSVVPFTGNISGQGNVILQNLVLNPVKGGNDATSNDTKISITKDKKVSELTLNNVSTKVKNAVDAKTTGFISSIGGTKNETIVNLSNCGNLIVKSGVSNIKDVQLDNTKLVSDGTVTVNAIHLKNNSSWDSLGKMTVSDIYTDTSSNEQAVTYIGVKQDKSEVPQFVLNGNVYDTGGAENAGKMLCKLCSADTTIADASTIFTGNSTKEIVNYANASLVSAPKADADKIRAYAYKDDETVISYKDGTYVKNGRLSDMQIKLTARDKTADGKVLSTSYAASFEDAVAAINNRADTGIYYDIQFIIEGTAEAPVVIKTTKKGTEYGTFTLPTKAAGVTISGYMPEGENAMPCTIIKYTGTLKASCNVNFENILLTEGKTDKTTDDGFVESGTITPVPTNYTLSFGKKVFTYQDSVSLSVTKDSINVNSVNATKGGLEFDGNNVVGSGAISIGKLVLCEGAKLHTTGKVTVTDLMADNNAFNRLESDAALAITNISKADDETGSVYIGSDFSKITKAGTFGNSQLTISGLIEDVNVRLEYERYNLTDKTYEIMDSNAFAGLVMKSDAKPDAYKKLATVPKASLDWITVVGSNAQYDAYNHNDANAQTYLYKYETGLYLTNLRPVVLVNGYAAPSENEETYTNNQLCYQAEFLTWDQAVKEIDKINNNKRYYKIVLMDSIGYSVDNVGNKVVNAPIGTVSMPSKAAEVWITSQAGEAKGIFFTGTTLTLKCNTRMDNAGFTCVKKYGSGTNTYYAPITYTMNIGNFKLSQENMASSFVGMSTVPYTVSGSAKGVFELTSDTVESREYAAIKGMNEFVVDYTSAPPEDGGNANLTVDCTDELNVKNLTVSNSTVSAKNVTVSNLATLDEAALQAGDTAKNDGKMNLKDIRLADNGNKLRAEQNSSGASQITISGTVTVADNAQPDALEDGTLEITLYYNNYKKGNNSQKPAQLYSGMILCTAQKVASDLFVPKYTVAANKDEGIEAVSGMGKNYSGYGLYKSGKNICYGKTADTREVMLEIGNSGMTTYFASFEEAVKEIDSLSLYKDPTAKTKVYEDYTITLLSDVEIGNAKKNNSYSSLSLPTKAKELYIDGNACEENGNEGYSLSFSGNVNVKCNTKLSDIFLYPIKNVKGAAVKTAANYAIGNYTLELDNVISTDISGVSLLGNVSGSSKSGTLKLAAGAESQVYGIGISQLSGLREVVLEEYTELHVAKTCNLYQISFGSGSAVLAVDGTLTTTLINAENAVKEKGVYGVIRKPLTSKMTVNGLYEDRDKDKIKEYYSLSFPQGEENGQIQVEVIGSPCPAGTLVLTGKNLNWSEVQDNIKVVNKRNELSSGSSCITYAKGTNLYIGEREE